MKNVPSGTQAFGPSGEILIYVIDYANRWLALWNSTACWTADRLTGGYAPGVDLRLAGAELFMDQQLTHRIRKATHGT